MAAFYVIPHPTASQYQKTETMIKKIAFFLTLTFVLSAWKTTTKTTTPSKTYTIEGIVQDDNGQALIGANVLFKGTSNGTVTDIDGKFTLQWNHRCADLQISYTGYDTKEERICAGSPAIVQLTTAQLQMEELIVTGMSKRPRRSKEYKKMDAAYAPASIMAYESTPVMSYAMPAGDAAPNFNTEDYDLIQENRFYKARQTPLSTFSIDVDAASYSNMRRFLQNGQEPPVDAVRIEEMVNYFNYEYPEPDSEHPFEVITEVSDCPWAPEHRLLHVGMQGKRIPMDDLPASNLVFLIDVSGSMNAANKLPLLKSSFKLLADQMREQDKVALVVYAGAAGLVLEPTSGANKQKIKDAIDKLSAGGSTAGGAGIQLAYKVAKENFVKGW